jgi:hypothetical protein
MGMNGIQHNRPIKIIPSGLTGANFAALDFTVRGNHAEALLFGGGK